MSDAFDYIPSDLADSLDRLFRILDDDTLRLVANWREQDMVRLHHGLGAGLRNSWGLWDDESRLTRHFNELGLTHADDMSSVILTSFWRQLHGEPLRVDEQVAEYRAYHEAYEAAFAPPPPYSCACGEEHAHGIARGNGGSLTASTVTFFAECPRHGWYECTGKDGRWTYFGPDPPSRG